LEILNGSTVTPEFLWLMLLTVYLCKETRRRGLNMLDWFSLPASMDLILAIYISDAGVCLKAFVIWIWRRFTPGAEFNEMQVMLLILSSAMIVVGALCKVRAWTRPDHGIAPWLVAMLSTIVVAVAMLALR
jgi:hypothetical protein